MKVAIAGETAGDRVSIEALKGFKSGVIRVQVEGPSGSTTIGLGEALALADALTAAVKYCKGSAK